MQQPVVVAVQRGSKVQAVDEVIVLPAPAPVALIHAANAEERSWPSPDAAARRAPEKEPAQVTRICLRRLMRQSRAYGPRAGAGIQAEHVPIGQMAAGAAAPEPARVAGYEVPVREHVGIEDI
jgi:hypothetical protein